MKRKDIYVIGLVALIAGIISIIVSGIIFGSPQKHPIKVPVVNKIDTNFPVVQNNSDYQSFFNSNALDPTQLIQIGGSSNNAPFQTPTQ